MLPSRRSSDAVAASREAWALSTSSLAIRASIESPSWSFIRAAAAEANAVFVMEASADGALKLERKGTGIYTLVFRGRASHAGLEPEKGVNAGMALALTLPLVAGLSDAEAGTTVVPTTITAGTTSNTVPAEAVVGSGSHRSLRRYPDMRDDRFCGLTPVRGR